MVWSLAGSSSVISI